jgi:integrase
MEDLPKRRTESPRFTFTEKRVASVESPDVGTVTVRDEREPGLVLLVTAGDARTYYAYYKFDGRPFRYKLGDARTLPVDTARQMCKAAMVKVAQGVNPHAERRAHAAGQTLGEFFKFFEKTAGAKKRSIGQDRDRFDRHFGKLANRRMAMLTTADVQSLHATIGAKHKVEANRCLALLRTLCRYAMTVRVIPSDPTYGVKMFDEVVRTRFLQDDELPKFMDAVEKTPDPTMRDLFKMFLYTGQRRGNVCAMRWDRIDFARSCWTIDAHTAKGKKAVVVPLSADAVKLLRERQKTADSDFVFSSYGRTGHIVEPKAAWKAMLKRAGLSGVVIHDVRRTIGSHATIGGASTLQIAAALGQSNQASTRAYAHLRNQDAQATLAKTLAKIKAKAKAKE